MYVVLSSVIFHLLPRQRKKLYTMNYTADIKKLPRKFLPEDFRITDWTALEPYFQDLLNRPIGSKQDLEGWLKDSSELEAVIGEDAAWRQIRMTCDTENKELEKAFEYFVLEIQPQGRSISRPSFCRLRS